MKNYILQSLRYLEGGSDHPNITKIEDEFDEELANAVVHLKVSLTETGGKYKFTLATKELGAGFETINIPLGSNRDKVQQFIPHFLLWFPNFFKNVEIFIDNNRLICQIT